MRYTLIFIFAFVCLSPAEGQQAARFESIRHIRDGDNHLRIGNWEYALQSYTQAIQADPSYADAWMKRASLNQMTGRFGESRTDYQQAVALNPYSTYIYDQRAAIGMLAGKPIQVFHGVPSERTDLYQADQHVDFNILQGHYQLALDQLDSLADIGMEMGYEHERMALVHLLLGEPETAIAHADSVLTLDPMRFLALDLKGLAYLSMGNCDSSLIHFNKTITLRPDFHLAYFNRACAYRCIGDRIKAIEDLNKSIELSRELGIAHFSRGLLRKEAGDTKGALEDYNQAVKSDSLFTSALFNRAFTYKMLGDYHQALSDANRIVEMDPDTPGHWNLKGNIHLLFGDYRDAVAAYDEAITLEPYYGEALFNRGLAHLMGYALSAGCSDLQASRNAGYQRAEEYIQLFCSP